MDRLLLSLILVVVLSLALFFAGFRVLRRFFSFPKVTASAVSGIVAVSLIGVSLALVFSRSNAIRADRASVVEEAPAPPPVGMLLPSNAEPRANDGVFGLILLGRRRPDNTLVCDRFHSALPSALNLADSYRFMLRPTYWPDRRQAGETPGRTNCVDLVTNYDWVWTNAVLNRLGLDGAVGPVLVAYGPAPNERGKLTRTILDLSSWPTSELARAFEGWIQSIISVPRDWRQRSDYEAMVNQFVTTTSDPGGRDYRELNETMRRFSAEFGAKRTLRTTPDPGVRDERSLAEAMVSLGETLVKRPQTATSGPGDRGERSLAEALRGDLHNSLIRHDDSLAAALVNPGDLPRRASADWPPDRQDQLPASVTIDLSR